MRYIPHDCNFENINQLIFSLNFLHCHEKVYDNKEFSRGKSNSHPEEEVKGPKSTHTKYKKSRTENIRLVVILKVRLSPYKKICVICLIESPLKMMKNAFYFILKTFRSQDIWPCRKNALIRKIRLTSKFMT